MNLKSQRKLARVATAVVVVIGIGIIAILAFPLDRQAQVAATPTDTKTDMKEPVQSGNGRGLAIQLGSLLNTKLQTPLVPPKAPVAEVTDKPKLRQRNWPNFELECIIASEAAKVAVFKSGNLSFTCGPGDEFLNVVVEEISPQKVELKFDGRSRTLQITGSGR